ncbi:hypothetical protein FRB90_012074 [Tulasnella sp. 427]|nr:hypothetical protein FRB90_012074 [Tulasnella sp. 427]
MPKLILIGVPMFNSASTIGGSRLLLNLRSAYFIKDPKSGSNGFGFGTTSGFLDTQGTVGKFWSSAMTGKDNDDEETSISMGVWSNGDVQRNRPSTPPQPAILLKPAPLGRRRGSISSGGTSDEFGSASAQVEEPVASGSGCSPTHVRGEEVETDQQHGISGSQEIALQFPTYRFYQPY